MAKELPKLSTLLRVPNPQALPFLEKAYAFAARAYAGKDWYGIPLITHAYETAKIIGEFNLGGKRTITAAFLQDVLARTNISESEIKKEFGSEMASIVRSITSVGAVTYQERKHALESLTKFFLTNALDVRVLIVTLGKRLNLIRMIAAMPHEDQVHAARETMDLYVPLAERLGIDAVKRELETAAFGILNPKAHHYINDRLRIKEHREKKIVANFKKSLLKIVASEKIPVIRTEMRIKSVYSIYNKLKTKGTIEQIYDIRAFRVVTKEVADCYRIMGILHTRWHPVPHRIKDYIATPKPDGYQSLHTTLLIDSRAVIEVQIRTEKMHQWAKLGILSHEYYKRDERSPLSRWFNKFFPPPDDSQSEDSSSNDRFTKVPALIKRLVDVNAYVSVETKFMEKLRSDFLKERMFVFNEQNEVVDLPKNATVIDFVFALEPKEAVLLARARVNRKLVALDCKLKNGDVVEIITGKNGGPREKWLRYGITPLARAEIEKHLNARQGGFGRPKV